jgi:hypothetical protein
MQPVKERTLAEMPFRPIYHLVPEPVDARQPVLEDSRALARGHVPYIGTNYDFTRAPHEQIDMPHAFLFRSLDDAFTAKQVLELVPGIERAPLAKFDGPEAKRVPFTIEELEKAGRYGFIPHDAELKEF